MSLLAASLGLGAGSLLGGLFGSSGPKQDPFNTALQGYMGLAQANLINMQSQIAAESWQRYKELGWDFENMSIQAAKQLIEPQAELQKAVLEQGLQDVQQLGPLRTEAQRGLLEMAAKGVDPTERAGAAISDVAQQQAITEQQQQMERSRYGLAPGDAPGQERASALASTAMRAGAGTSAAERAEQETFQRRATATGLAGAQPFTGSMAALAPQQQSPLASSAGLALGAAGQAGGLASSGFGALTSQQTSYQTLASQLQAQQRQQMLGGLGAAAGLYASKFV